MKSSTTANGDLCPTNPEHGRMFAYELTRRQFCPHADHSRASDPAVFAWDGQTPIRRPAPTSSGAGRR